MPSNLRKGFSRMNAELLLPEARNVKLLWGD